MRIALGCCVVLWIALWAADASRLAPSGVSLGARLLVLVPCIPALLAELRRGRESPGRWPRPILLLFLPLVLMALLGGRLGLGLALAAGVAIAGPLEVRPAERSGPRRLALALLVGGILAALLWPADASPLAPWRTLVEIGWQAPRGGAVLLLAVLLLGVSLRPGAEDS